ncbi:MAG: MFS transporter [Steroidobacteraceae bacterium]
MPTVIDLASFINAYPLKRFQVRIALLCASVLFLDSFDSAALGYVAPAITELWHLPRGALGPVFASGFFGQLIGAVVAGPVADRVGRKPVMVAACIAFGVGALITTQASSLSTLLAVRLLTGVGLGAALPNAVALTTEYSPLAFRSRMLVLVFCGITLGSVVAGLTAAHLLPLYGWTGVFWIGGLAPLVFAPVLARGLSESPYLLALRGHRDEQISAILRRISSEVPPDAHFTLHEENAAASSPMQLFTAGRSLTTILLWVVVFMNNLEIYVFASWLPTLARASGLAEQASVLTGVAMTAGGFAGTLAMGWLLDRFPIERMMAVNYTAAAVFIALLALSAGERELMGLFAAATGFCIVGGQTGANALIAYRHPTFIRATALAWALGSGRVASIFGPLGAGWIISLGWSSRATFLLAVMPALCASLAALRLPSSSRQTGVSDVSA